MYYEGSAEDLPLPGLFRFDSRRSRVYPLFFVSSSFEAVNLSFQINNDLRFDSGACHIQNRPRVYVKLFF